VLEMTGKLHLKAPVLVALEHRARRGEGDQKLSKQLGHPHIGDFRFLGYGRYNSPAVGRHCGKIGTSRRRKPGRR